MGTTCKYALLVEDFYLVKLRLQFMLSFWDNNQEDVIETIFYAYRYINDAFDIDNSYFAKNGETNIHMILLKVS